MILLVLNPISTIDQGVISPNEYTSLTWSETQTKQKEYLDVAQLNNTQQINGFHLLKQIATLCI